MNGQGPSALWLELAESFPPIFTCFSFFHLLRSATLVPLDQTKPTLNSEKDVIGDRERQC